MTIKPTEPAVDVDNKSIVDSKISINLSMACEMIFSW